MLFYYGTNFTFLQPSSGGSWGSEITFGRAIADTLPQENFCLIKHSDGGTSLWAEWNLTNGRSYNLFKEVVHDGLNALTKGGHTYEIVGIFQNQLRLRDFQIDLAGGSLTWASSPGKAYRITGSEDLQDFPHEVAVDIDSQGAETSRSFAIPAPLSGSPRAFFRVEER